MPTKTGLLTGVALLVAFLAQGWCFVRANSQTHDEAAHLAAGYSYLTRHDFRLNPEHPPLLKELAALPIYLRYRLPFEPPETLWDEAEQWGIGREFLYHSRVPHDELLTLGRLPGLAMGALLVGLVGWWSHRLWGPRAAFLAMALAAFEPNLVANAGLITQDMGSALFIFLTMYLLWEYGNRRSKWFLVGAGLCTGLALASKATGVLLFGVGGMILLAHVVLLRSPLLPAATEPARRDRLKQAVAVGGVIAILAALAILATYFFQGWGTWLVGFFTQASLAETHWPAFFLGDYSREGWLLYYPVAFLMKTPVATVALIAASLTLFRAGMPLRGREALFLLLPVAVILGAMIVGRVDVGARYVLPIYPFLFVCAGRLATLSLRRRWLTPALLGVPVLLAALSSLRQAPHQLAYFNELAGGPGEGRRYLLDSNIDWGQDLKGLKEYIDREGLPEVTLAYFGTAPPEAYGIRYRRAPNFDPVSWPPEPAESPSDGTAPSVLAVSVNSLQGLYLGEPGPYRPFALRVPKATVGASILIYDLGDADAHDDLARVYLYAAERELDKAARNDQDGKHEAAEKRRQGARQWRRWAGEQGLTPSP
ncbi:MAG TPA: phospholipid carrier-dependent glycosyltransferase [Gemmataceae bacterium]|nr:phospholipid carrier-dependent glycosyltransferase [Gemmataceae bacterium]